MRPKLKVCERFTYIVKLVITGSFDHVYDRDKKNGFSHVGNVK